MSLIDQPMYLTSKGETYRIIPLSVADLTHVLDAFANADSNTRLTSDGPEEYDPLVQRLTAALAHEEARIAKEKAEAESTSG